MTEQNRKYVTKEIGKLLSEIWRIKGLTEQEYGPQHPIIEKLASMWMHRSCCKENRSPLFEGDSSNVSTLEESAMHWYGHYLFSLLHAPCSPLEDNIHALK